MADNDCIDALWIETVPAGGAWTLAALSELSGLAASELRELVDYARELLKRAAK